jgi:hypothetical protein
MEAISTYFNAERAESQLFSPPCSIWSPCGVAMCIWIGCCCRLDAKRGWRVTAFNPHKRGARASCYCLRLFCSATSFAAKLRSPPLP